MAETNEKGFWQNKSGEWVHPDMVSIDKKLEDEVVDKLIDSAKEANGILKDFKIAAFAECYDFVDLLRQEYGLNRMEKSMLGSVTLKNFNGTREVCIRIAKLITFDQKLTLAKEKIDEYLDEKTENADGEIKTLISRAFDVKNGKVDAKQIFSLKAYPIDNPKWQEAMKMIDDATEIAGTKSYILFKEKANSQIDGELKSIDLSLSGISITATNITDEQRSGDIRSNKSEASK